MKTTTKVREQVEDAGIAMCVIAFGFVVFELIDTFIKLVRSEEHTSELQSH